MLYYFCAARQHNNRFHSILPAQYGKATTGNTSEVYIYIYIQTNFMRYGKSPGAFTVVTLKPGIIKIQANSLHIYTENLKDLDTMAVQRASKNSEFHNENAIG